jgi:queuine tRNA-ribosyltransferase
MVAEPTAPRLLTIHNLAFVLALVDRIRSAVAGGTLTSLRAEVAAVWDDGRNLLGAGGGG